MNAEDLLDRLETLGVEVVADGDRLRVNAARGLLTEELRSSIASRKQELLALLARRGSGAQVPIPRVPRDGPLPLSFFQERLWLLNRFEPGSTAYNLAALWQGESGDPALAADALRAVVRRHEILRTTVREDAGVPSVRILDPGAVPVEVHDLRGRTDQAQREAIVEAMQRATHTPFDLARDPPVRFEIHRLAEDRLAIMAAAHHIAVDAWSFSLLGREIAAAIRGGGALPPPAPLQYVDFAAWQRERLSASAEAGDLAWWLDRLAGLPPVSTLPADHPRTGPAAGSARLFRLGAELTGRLRTLVLEEGATLYMALVAACATALQWHSGQDDIVLGSPMGLRERPELEGVIGPFVNLLALRLDLADDPTFAELVGRARAAVLDAHAHRDVPFEKLVERLNPIRSRDHSPLFQVAVVQHDAPGEFSPQLASGGSIFDVTWFVHEEGGELVGSLEYRTDIYRAETIDRLAARLQAVLEAGVADRHRRLSALSLATAEERRRVLEDFNATDHDTDPATFVELFERQVAATPEACAVVFEGARLTYRQLDAGASRVARLLRSRGVGPGVLVALYMRRSLELLPALIGIQKAGGAYVPLDPDFPPDRLEFMLADSGARALVTHGAMPPGVGVPAGVLCVDLAGVDATEAGPGEGAARRAGPDDLAYVLYTSGSTGRPKGVRIRQAALSNFLQSMRAEPGLGPGDVLVAVTTLSFDIAALELYLPLLVGAPVHLVSKETAGDGAALARELASSGATVLQATPATWRLLVEAGWRGPPGFRAFSAGEALPREVADAILPRASEVWNLYGPTETTVYSAVERILPGKAPILVGRPIYNTRIYVLNRGGHPSPPGIPGEIWIGGVGVAEGYHARPELTAERFLPDPFVARPGARMYRTGDLGRWCADGRLEHLGRLDHQVKVRGFRIELGEIESELVGHPSVRQAVVVTRELAPGDVRLVGYVACHPGRAPTASELREHLRKRLPEYMLPSAIVLLEAIPLTPNGKVDRRALPAPGAGSAASAGERIPPRDALEAEIAGIWEAVLGTKVTSVRDGFFDLGGHSLLATRVFARMEQATGVALPLATLLEEDTVEHLASRVRERQQGAPGLALRRDFSSLVVIRPEGSRPPLFCVHGAGGNVLNLYALAHRLTDRPFYALQARGLDGKTRPHDTIEEMAAEYLAELRTLQPRGPYFLSGYCGGGLVAYELAQRLQAAGEQVALLGLIDLYRPGLERASQLRNWFRVLVEEDLSTKLRKAWVKVRWFATSIVRLLRVKYALKRGRTIPHELRDFALMLAYFKAEQHYRIRPYSGKVTVFRAAAGYSFMKDPGHDLGWGTLARDVAAHEVPGDHDTLTVEPNVSVLAARLDACLDEAERAPPPPAR